MISKLVQVVTRTRKRADDDRSRIELAQLEMRAKLVPLMVATGLVVALAIYWTFYLTLPWGRVDYPIAAVGVSYLYLFGLARSWKRAAKSPSIVEKFKWLFCSAQFFIGATWAWFIAAGLPLASASQRSVFYALTVGLMSTPAFYGPREYALALWLPLTIGATVALALSPSDLPVLPSLAGLFGYAVLTFSTILRVDKRTKATERQRLEAERQSDTIAILMREFQNDASDWLWETDEAVRIIQPSERFAAAAEERPESLAGRFLLDFMREQPPGLEPPPTEGGAPASLRECLRARIAFRDRRVLIDIHGRERWWLMTGKPTLDQYGRFQGYRGVASDVTRTYQAEQEIRFLATHDALTKLGNRASFDQALAHACSLRDHRDLALLCLDLDHFKRINDTHGHKVGDAVLVATAQRLQICVRPQDRVFRLGGDEFAVLLVPADRDEASVVARRITAKLSTPFTLGGVTARIGVCVGIAMLTDSPAGPGIAHHQPDLALYAAKAAGRGTVSFADRTSDAAALAATADLGTDLLTILDEKDIFVEYQPIIDLTSGQIRSFEALVRWRHPTRGLLYPDEFISVAEDNGSISRIGWAVLEKVLVEVPQLPDGIGVAVNISPAQLHDVELVTKLEERIRVSGVEANRLHFEITEKIEIERRHDVDSFFKKMQMLGCRICLDDFGSGYSSIKSIFEFPFDKIKIDRALVSEALSDARKFEVLEGVRDLAHRIGATVTIEGIETEQEAEFVRAAGFEEAQGYYFGRPTPSPGLFRDIDPDRPGSRVGLIELAESWTAIERP